MATEIESANNSHEEGVYRSRVTPGESPSEAVIRTVASASGREPVRTGEIDGTTGIDVLEPLYGAIDPDALDSLFHSSGGTEQPSVEVTFAYCGHVVTVESTGDVTVAERERN